MNRIKSKISVKSAGYIENYEHSKQIVAELKQKLEEVKLGGPEIARKRHTDRGKILVRDRIAKLCDKTESIAYAPQLGLSVSWFCRRYLVSGV